MLDTIPTTQQPQTQQATQKTIVALLDEVRRCTHDAAIRLRLAQSRTLPLDARAFETVLTQLEGERLGHAGRGVYDVLRDIEALLANN